ncbi:hypothetical protein [Budvicia aquatica]|uniref:hypothetical protein n=1 Tax=Budvicia aquatica TaxID=82979 RepID=UPI0021C39AEB|nr:hypothetical protein [Budvicia aquatica]
MESTKLYVPWIFTIFFHIVIGPLLLLFLSCMLAAFPSIIDGFSGFLGMILFIVPFIAAMALGLIPFTLLGIASGLLMRLAVNRYVSIFVIAILAAILGYISSIISGNDRPFLVGPVMVSAILCYVISSRHQKRSPKYSANNHRSEKNQPGNEPIHQHHDL